MKKSIQIAVLLALGMGVRMAMLMTHPADRTPWSDGAQYVNLGASLADGRGYVLEQGNYWPGQPTIIRAPGWPMFLSAVFRVVPRESRWAAARSTAAALDSLNAVLVQILAAGMGAGAVAAFAAALLYALNPVAAGMCALPASEPLGIALILLFLIRLARPLPGRGRWLFGAGLLLGGACLVRTNFLLIAGAFGLGYFWSQRKALARAVGVLVLFSLGVMGPVCPWLVRNAVVFHRFPVLGAGGGETFYGGNNDLASEPGGRLEGYLVLPGDLPREKPLAELAATMNECQVDAYLFKHGWQWLKTNPEKIPRLVVAKLRRACVPIPRSRGLDAIAGNGYRAMVDLLAVAGLALYLRTGRRIRPAVSIALWSVVLTQAAVVAVFCGLFRFFLPAEILLVLPAGYALRRLQNPSGVFAGEKSEHRIQKSESG